MTSAYKTQAQLTDDELLQGLEAEARDRWQEAWDRGAPVLTAWAHRDLVPGIDQWSGFHRIVVRYMPSGQYAYFYRVGPYTWPTPCLNRDDALNKVRIYRVRAVAS